MGMYDYITCKYKLPIEIDSHHQDHWFQTKSLGCDLDYYEIREDGSLWQEDYDIEDRSDPSKIGLAAFAGSQTRINKRMIPRSKFTGEVVFYTQASSIGQVDRGQPFSGWLEFSAYFVAGEMKHLELICFEEPATTTEG